mmetsp:Transcript_117956/g.251935  ORF Transcript_117956/g.251935 Transcript_117956/m.251935 type:complete len:80 (-) Transcript_117956:1463-1702(-)
MTTSCANTKNGAAEARLILITATGSAHCSAAADEGADPKLRAKNALREAESSAEGEVRLKLEWPCEESVHFDSSADVGT